MSSWRIFIDMDGVLFDFVKGASQAHGRPSPYADSQNHGMWDMARLWGISEKEFWKPLDHKGFWTGLDLLEGAKELVRTCASAKIQGICVLSSPSQSLYCVPEKRASLHVHFPEFGNNILFGSAKHMIVSPDSILIDDYDVNINKWTKAGGVGFLWPQPWNSGYQDTSKKSALQRLSKLLNR